MKEVGFGTAACPKSMYVLHMTSSSSSDVVLDEGRVLSDPERLIWSASWSLKAEQSSSSLANVHLVSGPSFELDYDVAIGNARRVFADMFGTDAEFLPRAPDPEEIVIGGGESNEDSAETIDTDKTSENTESLKSDA